MTTTQITVRVLGTRWAVDGLIAALNAPTVGTAILARRDALPDGPRPDVVVVVADDDERTRALVAEVPLGARLLIVGASPTLARELQAPGWLPLDTDVERLRIAIQALALGLAVMLADPQAFRPAAPGIAGSDKPVPRRAGEPAGEGETGEAGDVADFRDELREPLTARELEVYELMAKGLGNRDIAAALGISAHTAKFHVARILDKTGSATRTEAVRQGLRWGLIGL